MNVRDASRERDKARVFFKTLDRSQRFQLGDDLVLGCFDWQDWGFHSKPTSAFLNEVDYQRILWESTEGG